MRFFGPNCYRFINYLDGVLLWPDQHGGRRVDRGVAIITQSGNIGLNLTMQQRGLALGYLVTLGNHRLRSASRRPSRPLLNDTRITAIGLHIEGLDDPVAFGPRRRARPRPRHSRRGSQDRGLGNRRAPHHQPHRLARRSDRVADAFLRRAGVVRSDRCRCSSRA